MSQNISPTGGVEARPTIRRNGVIELDGNRIGDLTRVPDPCGKVGEALGYRIYVRGCRYDEREHGIFNLRRDAVAEVVRVWKERVEAKAVRA